MIATAFAVASEMPLQVSYTERCLFLISLDTLVDVRRTLAFSHTFPTRALEAIARPSQVLRKAPEFSLLQLLVQRWNFPLLFSNASVSAGKGTLCTSWKSERIFFITADMEGMLRVPDVNSRCQRNHSPRSILYAQTADSERLGAVFLP